MKPSKRLILAFLPCLAVLLLFKRFSPQQLPHVYTLPASNEPTPRESNSTLPLYPSDAFRWENISDAELEGILSPLELLSIPSNLQNNGTCKGAQIEPACCLGTISQNGGNRLFPGACYRDIPATKELFVQRYPVRYNLKFSVNEQDVLYDMGDVLRALGKRSLFFLGDSVMHQTWDAALCDIGRRTGKDIKVDWFRRERLWSQVGTMQRFVASIEGYEAKLFFHREYKFSPNGLTMKEVCKVADVLVFNYGLHWAHLNSYENDMRVLARLLRVHCSRAVLIFRGSNTQHFFTETGVATKNRHVIAREVQREVGAVEAHSVTFTHKVRHMGCKPRRIRPRKSRDDVVMDAFRKESVTVLDLGKLGTEELNAAKRDSEGFVVYFIPFGDISAPLYDFHFLECTHFCYTPQIWAPVSHYIYKVIGESFDKKAEAPLHDPKPWTRMLMEGAGYDIDDFNHEGNLVYKVSQYVP